ncbi:MAG: protoporphyrinogen oxidase [Actinomycetota bacterium]
MRVVVVGAGISGLAAAWDVSRRHPEADVVVLEAADRVGGKLRVAQVAGLPVDVGAEALLTRRPEGVQLIRELGVDDRLIAPLSTAASIVAGGATHPLPARTVLGIPSDVGSLQASGVLSPDAIAAVQNEPAAGPMPPITADITVGAMVRRRFGDEVVDRLVQPLLGGVYAGRADELSLEATVPALYAQLSSGGSLLTAARTVADDRNRADVSGPIFASLRGGLGSLPQALAATGRFTVRTGVTVRTIRRAATGFTLDCGPVPFPEAINADAVIVATPAAKASALLRDVAPLAAQDLAGIESASLAIVTFAFAGVVLPTGSGLLVGAREPFGVKAVTQLSQKWPGTPEDLVLLRASIGRAGDTRDLQLDDADLAVAALRDLRTLIGLDADPVDTQVTRWGGGLPQYALGHVARIERIRASVAGVPGLAVCGAAYDGIGIPACIASARRAVDQLLAATLASGQ